MSTFGLPYSKILPGTSVFSVPALRRSQHLTQSENNDVGTSSLPGSFSNVANSKNGHWYNFHYTIMTVDSSRNGSCARGIITQADYSGTLEVPCVFTKQVARQNQFTFGFGVRKGMAEHSWSSRKFWNIDTSASCATRLLLDHRDESAGVLMTWLIDECRASSHHR